jgi:nucleotidyltransferase/DNA polymerase involved in DNA repair
VLIRQFGQAWREMPSRARRGIDDRPVTDRTLRPFDQPETTFKREVLESALGVMYKQ